MLRVLRTPPALHMAPNLMLLRHYRREFVRGDLVAGVTVAAYLVPQVMAYAAVAGLPPVAGLWAIVPCMVIYALLGSSRQLSVGPESTTALITASIVAPLAGGSAARYAGIAAALALVFGAFCLIAWLLRLGFVADLLSRPVLVGYIAGVAVIMAVSQLGKITGTTVDGETLWEQLRSFARSIDDVNLAPLWVAAATFVILVAMHRLAPGLPAALIAVVTMTLATAVFDLDEHGVAVVGPLEGGMPHVAAPPLSSLHTLLLPALGLLVVGYTDNVLTARAFASRQGYEIDANQELLALGACNVGSSLVHGFPVSSSASRTAVGDVAGSRTQAYSIVALAAVLLTMAFLRPVLANFPIAALGGLVIYAAARLVDIAEFRRLAAFRRRELLLALAAVAAVLTLGILYGVLLAVLMSVVELLARVARPHDAILGTVPGLAGMHDVDDYSTAQQANGLVVYRYDSPLFFANAEDFRRRALESVGHAPGHVFWFLLNVEAIVEVDITGLDALESVRSTLSSRGIIVALARVKQDLLDDLVAYGLADSIGRDLLFPTLPTAMAAYDAWLAAGRHEG
jgi:sulfate permease, SulP family